MYPKNKARRYALSNDVMTIPEAAALLSVTAKTIREMLRRGVIGVARTEPYGVFRKRVYVWRTEIERLKELQASINESHSDPASE